MLVFVRPARSGLSRSLRRASYGLLHAHSLFFFFCGQGGEPVFVWSIGANQTPIREVSRETGRDQRKLSRSGGGAAFGAMAALGRCTRGWRTRFAIHSRIKDHGDASPEAGNRIAGQELAGYISSETNRLERDSDTVLEFARPLHAECARTNTPVLDAPLHEVVAL